MWRKKIEGVTNKSRTMPKESLRDKLEDNDLDLSLSNLETVPVKELAALPKATNLDLSCNLISVLPDAFCKLKHLVKIDLSKNRVTELPSNFGELSNLQQLDLLGNKLHVLPLSFSNLKRLKWLDMKDNPLDEGLKKAAGDCLDDVQCKRCAQQVLAFMKAVNSDVERQRQKKLQEEREKEASKKAEEEAERHRKKAAKLAEKERRRKELEANKRVTVSDNEESSQLTDEGASPIRNTSAQDTLPVKAKGGGWGMTCCLALFNILLAVLAVTIGLYIYCDMKKIIPQCQQVVNIGDQVLHQVKTTYNHYLKLMTDKR